MERGERRDEKTIVVYPTVFSSLLSPLSIAVSLLSHRGDDVLSEHWMSMMIRFQLSVS